VYVGVSDDGHVAGVPVGKGTIEVITNRIARNTNLRLVPSIQSREAEGKTILLIEVPENPLKPVYAFDRALRRAGKTNQRLAPDEAARLYYESRGMTWDESPFPNMELSDVDPTPVGRFLSLARHERQWNIDPRMPVKKVVEQLELIRFNALTYAVPDEVGCPDDQSESQRDRTGASCSHYFPPVADADCASGRRMICTRTPPCLELVQELICVSHSAPADIQQRNKVAGAKLFFDEFLQERNTSQ